MAVGQPQPWEEAFSGTGWAVPGMFSFFQTETLFGAEAGEVGGEGGGGGGDVEGDAFSGGVADVAGVALDGSGGGGRTGR